jgi:aromatic-L-amino-acid/L-tryptophan decarboxylase
LSTIDTSQHPSFSSTVSVTRDPSPLEMDAETFYQLGIQAVEMATEYLEGIPEKPVFRPMTPSERQLLLSQQMPEHGRSPEALFDFFEQHILPHAMGNQHPRFAAWVNPAGAPIGMLAEFLAAVMNPSSAGVITPRSTWSTASCAG